MIERKAFVTLTWTVAVVALLGATFAGWRSHGGSEDSRTLARAAWKERFEAPSDLARRVDAIVVAEVVAARPGRIAWSDNGQDSLPFEEVILTVYHGIKGIQSGEQIVVERAGGDDGESRPVYLDADGGPFATGATYMLFLKRQEDGPFYYQVNDQGRYRIADDRLVAVSADDPVAGFLHGRSLGKALGLLNGYLRAPDQRRGGPSGGEQ